MNNLAEKTCEACNKFTPKLGSAEIRQLLEKLDKWQAIDDHHLLKRWKFKDFAGPVKFVNEIGQIAEREGHHPNINFSWGYVEISVWTHAINGLSKNDFILAAKIDQIKI